ncbi:MAG: reverse transcriptase domain-containing protein [Planctomycetaceae bacterium]
MHLGKPYIWSRDIKDCFPSISKRLINRKLIALGFRPDVALLLSRLGSYHDSVPQGSPLSSDILNLVLWDIDQKAASRCGYHKLSYSRFADDIVVSGYNKSSGDKEIRRIEEDLDKIDLKINHSKRRKNGLQTNRSEQFLHGIQVNSKKGTKIPKKLSRKVNHLADSFIHGCKRIQPSSIESLASKRRQLVGYLHYLNQFDIKSLKHLKTKIKQGDEIVLRCFKKNRISVHKNKWWIENPFRSEPKRLKIQWIRKLVVS